MTTPGWWWCTRKVSHACAGLVRTMPNCPNGSMCPACRLVVHRYDTARNEKRSTARFKHVIRTAWKSKYPHRNRRVKAKQSKPQLKRCGYPGCTQPVYESPDGMIKFRTLCLYHWQHGEHLMGVW